MHKDYLDGKLTTLTHESLVGMAKSKFNYLHTKGTWGARSPNDDKIIAMTAAINGLKEQLKLSPQLATAGGKHDGDGMSKKGQKTRNKKNTSDHVKQKKDKAWKKVPPKDGKKKEKVYDKRTYHWYVHHMAWTMHSPSKCRLGTERKGEKPNNMSHSAAVAAAATVNPHYAALLLTLASIADKEELWCKPAWMLAAMWTFMAGPNYLDTGQFLTYLQVLFLPIFLRLLFLSTIPNDPHLQQTTYNVLVQGTSWWLQGGQSSQLLQVSHEEQEDKGQTQV
jgi:hypothetical protein